MTVPRNILLCIALFLLALAVTKPVYEMGFMDDWSYSHIAREFASSGHVVYDGHTAVMLLPQIVWSGLFIKLFGFSFLVMRLSTVVLAVVLIPVLYDLGRVSGLDPPCATFATLLTMLSPLVLPVTATFLSDFPAFFLFVVCFYGGVKSWQAAGTKTCVAWGSVVAVAGMLSGLDRQIYWIAPLLFLPVLAWVRRRERGALVGLGAAWLGTIAVVAYSVVWFFAKPYILVEHTLDQWKQGAILHLVRYSLSLFTDLVLTGGLILLPLLIAYIKPGLGAVSRLRAVLVMVCGIALEYMLAVVRHHQLPTMGNILTEYGVQPTWPGLVVRGMPPLVLTSGVRHLITAAVLICFACGGLVLWSKRRGVLRDSPAAPALLLGLVFAAGWIPALVVRSIGALAYDRYLIAFLPLAAIPLLRFYQVNIGPRVSYASWLALALFSLYGVATTHDAFAVARARSIASRNLEQAGIPRTEIDAGFEYDGWTQLETTGYINAPLMETPAGAYRQVACVGLWDMTRWYPPMTPAVHARYFVVIARLPELVDGSMASIDYTTWLPFGHRQVFTQVLPGGGYAGCS